MVKSVSVGAVDAGSGGTGSWRLKVEEPYINIKLSPSSRASSRNLSLVSCCSVSKIPCGRSRKRLGGFIGVGGKIVGVS